MFSEFPNINNINIISPLSMFNIKQTLFLKTLIFSQLYRVFNIFKIGEVFFYVDEEKDSNINSKIIIDLYQYLKFSPYLRKYIKIKENLKYTGIIPPIQSPNHIGIKIGKTIFKEGYLLNINKIDKKALVDIGSKCIYADLPNEEILKKLEINNLVCVQFYNNKYSIISIDKEKYFWYPEIIVWNKSLVELILYLKNKNNNSYFIGATKYGIDFNKKSKFLKKLSFDKKFYLIFGPNHNKLTDFLQKKNCINYIDILINFIPNQGTQTIRAEEAIIFTIASMYNIL